MIFKEVIKSLEKAGLTKPELSDVMQVMTKSHTIGSKTAFEHKKKSP